MYKTLIEHEQALYGCKVCKLSIDAGFTRPNWDGTLDTRGCVFCSARGGGAFAAPVERLKPLREEAIAPDEIVGLAIGTRPGCLGPMVSNSICSRCKKGRLWKKTTWRANEGRPGGSPVIRR